MSKRGRIFDGDARQGFVRPAQEALVKIVPNSAREGGSERRGNRPLRSLAGIEQTE